MHTADRPQAEVRRDHEVMVRYIDQRGFLREQRLHAINLAAFIRNNIRQAAA